MAYSARLFEVEMGFLRHWRHGTKRHLGWGMVPVVLLMPSTNTKEPKEKGALTSSSNHHRRNQGGYSTPLSTCHTYE